MGVDKGASQPLVCVSGQRVVAVLSFLATTAAMGSLLFFVGLPGRDQLEQELKRLTARFNFATGFVTSHLKPFATRFIFVTGCVVGCVVAGLALFARRCLKAKRTKATKIA